MAVDFFTNLHTKFMNVKNGMIFKIRYEIRRFDAQTELYFLARAYGCFNLRIGGARLHMTNSNS